MPAIGETPVFAFGENFVFSKVSYSGASATFSVDQRAVSVCVVAPAGGPTATLGAAADGLKTVTLAAGGANQGGSVIVATAYGKARAGFKP
mgnify:CR=1 FL=1